MIFRRSAMCFGATASVWGFNRFADSMVFLFHHLFLGTSLHFVGDFGGIEPSVTAASAFQCFGDFFSCLGLHMKAKKAEPPNHVQKLLGVIIEIEHNGVRLSPCPERITKLLTVLTVQHLDTWRSSTFSRQAGFPPNYLFWAAWHSCHPMFIFQSQSRPSGFPTLDRGFGGLSSHIDRGITTVVSSVADLSTSCGLCSDVHWCILCSWRRHAADGQVLTQGLS